MTRRARVLIEKNARGYSAWCPELEGCLSQGDTLEEVLANIREAIEQYLSHSVLPINRRKRLQEQVLVTLRRFSARDRLRRDEAHARDNG